MCAICLLNVHESQWKFCLQPDDRYFASSPFPLHHNQKDLDTHPVSIVRLLCRKAFKLARHSSANLLLVHFESVAVVHIELPRIIRQLPCSVCGKNYSNLWHKATPQAVEETFCNYPNRYTAVIRGGGKKNTRVDCKGSPNNISRMELGNKLTDSGLSPG